MTKFNGIQSFLFKSREVKKLLSREIKPHKGVQFAINFIPIILLYLLVTYTPEFVKFSHTILGKALAVILILFYVKLDLIIGLFVCALVVFYYQTDYVESFNNMLNEGFTEKEETTEEKEEFTEEEKDNEDTTEKKVSEPVTENFERLEDAYPTKEVKHDIATDNFRKSHCEKGHLIHKGQIIKPEMSEHVYPILQSSEFNKCNICDTKCNFEIINNRLTDESDLTKPKRSNDMFEKVWENLRTTTEQLINKE
jgi:hypothetical protein